MLESLAKGRRRDLLGILLDRVSPVAERELAIQLAATEQGASVIDVTSEEVQRVRTRLHHVDLPKLETVNLVEWDREDATVTTTGHPALSDPHLHQIIGTEAPEWDAVVTNLADERRRIVLSVLADRECPVSRRELARSTAARGPTGDSRLDEEELFVTLHHVHLPKLANAGLVEYDADADVVTYEGHSDLDEDWFAFDPEETPRSVLPAAQSPRDIWSLESRENVVEHGRSLVDQAEDELFVMVTTNGLLEEECIQAFEDAIERGVDVYFGAQTKVVRDLVRERLPEALIWEPQLDRLELSPERERVGRLVFADRESIMLATLGETTNTGLHEETAITGTGEDNALVVLMREILGSRLDHLDSQSGDSLTRLSL